MTSEKKTVNVWDPVVRIGHWVLVIAFFTAYVTEDEWIRQHVWAGYVVGAVVLIRLLWGVVGSRYARFSNFICKPSKSIAYMKNLITGRPQHYLGHNPAGGMMVLALLGSLAGTTLTGLKLYAVEENKGPLALSQRSMPSFAMISKAKAEIDDDDEEAEFESGFAIDKDAEEFWEELHETFANITLILVLLHIGGVMASSLVNRENLVKAMITGNKEIDDSKH